jgi:predicted acyl esterase
LSNSKSSSSYELANKKPVAPGALTQIVDFSDRSDEGVNNIYPSDVITKQLHLRNGFTFISQPFEDSISISGAVSGVIRATINKYDMDVSLSVYEVTPEGEFFNLSYFVGRASFAHDMTARHLLRPNHVESIPIQRTPVVSRQLKKGSRLLVLLTVNKNKFSEINYGTGKDVADESVADAKVPLRVRWQNDSYITVPISNR